MKKKFLSIMTAFAVLPACIVIPANANVHVPDYSLWEKFLKYDLCITDYSALTDEEKALCKFIFETEQSTDQTIICERARRTLAHDQNIGERLTLEELDVAYGVWDNYSVNNVSSMGDISCVPDIKYLDGWDDYNEYWLNDNGTEYVRFTGENSRYQWSSFKVHSNTDYEIEIYAPFLGADFDEYIKDDNMYYTSDSDNYICYNGDYYAITADNEAVFVKSKYSMTYLRNIDNAINEKIVIPDEIEGYPVTRILDGAFKYALVTDITLPDTVEVIGSSAFEGCIYLENFNFPKNLRYVGSYAFSGCSFETLELDYPELKISYGAFYCCDKLTDVVLNVDSIAENAFFGCKVLKNLTFREGIEKISSEAFMGCEAIENISLPSSLRAIGTGAFSGFLSYSTGIKSITIPPTVEIIGSLPVQRGDAATSGLEYSATHPLTDDPECVFDSDCVIYGYRGTEAERYADEWDLEFVPLEAEAGDVNIDGEVNIADVVSLQRYLLRKYVRTGAYYGDINGDGTVDVFDMILMRKKSLIK